MKHRIEDDPIARNILLTVKRKLPEYRKDVLAHIIKTEDISDEGINQSVADIRRRYLDSVYEDIYAQAEKYKDAQERLRSYRLSEDGKNGIMAGKIYAAIYPSLTGKEASPDDCIALNHVQTTLMDQILDEIEKGESPHSSLPKNPDHSPKSNPHKSKIDSSLKAAIIVICFLLVISLAVALFIQNTRINRLYDTQLHKYEEVQEEYEELQEKYEYLGEEYGVALDFIEYISNEQDLEFANATSSYYHKYRCYLFHPTEHFYYGSTEVMKEAGYLECSHCH